MAVVLVLGGVTLIGWNMRDPDRAFREPPSVERVVTLKETPQAVQETIKRISADGTIEDVKEDRKGNTTTYEVDVIRDNTKTEYEISADGLVIEQESKKRKS
jgi:hypothetical protein